MNEHSAIRDLLSLAAARVLNPAEQQRVEEHLRHCEACCAEWNGWMRLANALKELPTPQAPPKLVLRTRRLLEVRSVADKERRGNQLTLALLIVFSWIVTILNWRLLRLFDIPLSQLLDVSSTALWVIYIGVSWLAAALAAALLVKHSRREGRIL